MKLAQVFAAAAAGVGAAWVTGKALAKSVKETVAPGDNNSATTTDTNPVETTGTTVEEKKEETE